MNKRPSPRSWGRHVLSAVTLLGGHPGLSPEPQAIYLVRDVQPGPQGSSPTLMTDVAGMLFFAPGNAAVPQGLWKSDGTTAGTVLVKQIRMPTEFSEPDRLASVGGLLFFTADDGVSGRELWRSDGTEAGTVRIKDINPGAAGSDPRRLTPVGSLVYFHAQTAAGGRELWRSDGTEAGTVQVKDVAAGPGGSLTSSAEIVPVAGIVYFNALGRLWRTDGSEVGTFEVRNPGGPTGVEKLTRVQDLLLFRGSDPTHGSELWRSDGTAAGTQMVKDVTLGAGSSTPYNLVAVGGTLFFVPVSGPGHSANEVWKSDGTEAGTVLVKDVLSTSFPLLFSFTAFEGRLYFVGQDIASGVELWTSDGTTAGTVPLDLNPGPGHTSPSAITVFDGRLFFTGRKPGPGNDRFLWRSDGTVAGSAPVPHGPVGSTARLAPAGARLYLSLTTPPSDTELWALLPLAVSPDPTVPEGDAGPSTVTLTLTLAAPSDRLVSVSFGTQDGTAVAGEDYEAVSDVVEFPPGVVTRTIEVTVLGDTIGENDETFGIRIGDPLNADPARDLVTVTIGNDDPPGFRVSDVVVAEGRSAPATATFRVDLFPAPVTAGSVSFATADGTAAAGNDYTAASGVVDFAVGQTTRLLSVPILQDALPEGLETFFVNLSNPVGGTIADSQGLGRILDAPGGMDFNGDRFTDLVWRSEEDGLNGVWFMNGVTMLPGIFPNMPALADPQWTIVGTNDFNADGKSDLLWRHATEGQNVVWFMNGPNLLSGTFTTPQALVDVRWKMVGTGDFDADGKPDILWRHSESGENVLWYMNGTVLTSGTFTNPPTLADVRWHMAGVGDFNRDGRPDILWHHRVSGQLVLWYMNDNTLLSGTFTTPPGLSDTGWQVGAVGDYNGDDRPDIVWRHQDSGQVVVWFMNDATLLGGSFTSPDTIGLVWRLVGPR
jgi:ELWxxDGT repeat protein